MNYLDRRRVIRLLQQDAEQLLGRVPANPGNAFNQLHRRILRYPVDTAGQWLPEGDVFQKVIAQTVPGVLTNTITQEQAKKIAVEKFLAEGRPFRDKSGRQRQPGSYAEMATRTAAARAYTEASVYRMQQSGINLVQIVVGAAGCQSCSAWGGKILSTDGITGERIVNSVVDGTPVTVYVTATLDQARAAG